MLNTVTRDAQLVAASVCKNAGIRHRQKHTVVTSRFYLLKKTKNVLGAKVVFSFFAFLLLELAYFGN